MINVIIDCEEMGVEYRDEGVWRSYILNVSGNLQDDLGANASVTEVDQDGGEITTYALLDSCEAVRERGYDMIEKALLEAHRDYLVCALRAAATKERRLLRAVVYGILGCVIGMLFGAVSWG